MTQNQEILYDSRFGHLTPEVAEKIRKSREEAKNLKGRTLNCLLYTSPSPRDS